MRRPRPCSRLARPITYAVVVADYVAHERPRLATDLAWFSQRQSRCSTIRRVAQASDANGRRMSHQWRLFKSVIPAVTPLLQASASSLFAAASFDQLYQAVEASVGHVHGVGPLYIYDTALRLGASKGLWPNKVYLHAGSLEGATRVLGRITSRHLPLSSFPREFRRLDPHEVENLLCLYAECL